MLGVADLKSRFGELLPSSTLYQAAVKSWWPGSSTLRCFTLEGRGVPRGGVEQTAVGDQLRLLAHDQRILTSGCTRRRVRGPGY